MKRVLLLLVLLLSACAAEPGYSDPYTQAGAANAAIQATEIAKYDMSQKATYTQAEFDRQAQATQAYQEQVVRSTAQSIQATSTAQAGQTTALAAARDAQATMSANVIKASQTAVSWRATESAINRLVEDKTKRAEMDSLKGDIVNGLSIVGIILVGAVSAIALAIAIWKIITMLPDWIDTWQDALREWADRKNALFRSPQGMIAFTWDQDGNFAPMFLEQLSDGSRPALPAPRRPLPLIEDGPCDFKEPGEVKNVTPSGSVIEYPTNGRERSILRGNAISLVRFSVVAYGGAARKIMPANDIESELCNQTWQDTVNAMKKAGCVVVQRGVGTFVSEKYQERLDHLLYALQNNEIRLIPTPTPPEPVETEPVEYSGILENAQECEVLE